MLRFGIVSRYREAKRFRQVVNTFLAYGFETVVLPRTPWHRVRRLFTGRGAEDKPASVRFREVLERLGPTFIKFGQLLSTRSDLLPDEWVEELVKLRDEVPPSPWEEIEAVLAKELGGGWRGLFRRVDERPVGSASIAQVHRAVLATGEEVVVKVRRPGIEEVVEVDIAVLRRIAQTLHRRIPELRIYRLPDLVDEFAFTIRREMDFKVEASNMERMRPILESSGVGVPEVFWDYTTRRVLVMELVPGVKLEDWRGSREEGCRLGESLALCFLRQVLEGGIFHADPHPANVVVCGDRLYLLDFGMVGFLDVEMREFVKNVFVAIVRRDYDTIVDWYRRMGLVEKMDTRRFKLELMGLVEPYLSQSLGRINIGEVVQRIVEVSIRYGVKFPSEFLMLGRAMLIVDGTVKRLCSHASVAQIVSPYAEELLSRSFSVDGVRREFIRLFNEVSQFKQDMSVIGRALAEVAVKAKEEGIKVKVMQDEIRDRELKRLGDRLVASTTSVGMFLAALFSWAFKVGWVNGWPLLSVLLLLGALMLLVLSFYLS